MMRIWSKEHHWYLFNWDSELYDYDVRLGFDKPCFAWNEL